MYLPRSLRHLLVLTYCLALFSGQELFAQQITTPPVAAQSTADSVTPDGNEAKKMPTIYAHVFGGAGFSWLASDDVKSFIDDDFGIGIGLPTWCYGLRCGFRNILQVEYNFGKTNHDFNNNSIIKSIPSEVVKMDYNTKEIQFKINPLFWKTPETRNGFTKAFFLVAGAGDVEWHDKEDDGFDGTSSILGIEFSRISKNVSFGFSMKRYAIEFDETTLFGIPFDSKVNAADYIFEIKVGVGLGA